MLTGRNGRITPRTVRVPPFISVRLVLRSADGASYAVRVGGRTLRASGSRRAAVTLEGLPTGERYTVTATEGAGGVVEVEASGEPGP